MAQNYTLGRDAVLYIGGTYAVDTTDVQGDAYTNIKDVTVTMSSKEIDVNTRATAATGWSASAPGLKEGAVKVKALWKSSDEIFASVKDAWLDGTEIGLAALSGADDADGSEGPMGNYVVIDFERQEGIDDAQSVDITFKPSSFMSWFENSGS